MIIKNEKLNFLVSEYKKQRDATTAIELAEYLANNYENLEHSEISEMTTLCGDVNTHDLMEATTLIMEKPELPEEDETKFYARCFHVNDLKSLKEKPKKSFFSRLLPWSK